MRSAIPSSEALHSDTCMVQSEAFRAELGQHRLRMVLPSGWMSTKSRERKKKRIGRLAFRAAGALFALGLLGVAWCGWVRGVFFRE
jgi:hypothetical protein